jgi:hypothetical protein
MTDDADIRRTKAQVSRSVDAWMRRRLGGGSPPSAAPEPEHDDLRAEVAEHVGLPPNLAGRLEGDSASDLFADARRMAADLAELHAEPDPEPVTFDGGARAAPPPAGPSADSLIRGQRDAQRIFAAEAADYYERYG